ncbi:hypothetical protein H0H87_009001, partial [Tephrocybe sp. NHM501043]
DENFSQKYAGPENLQRVLAQSVAETRHYLRPFFNDSTLSGGFLTGTFHGINVSLTQAAQIHVAFLFPQKGCKIGDIETLLATNCTAVLRKELGITTPTNYSKSNPFLSCGYFGTQSTMASHGDGEIIFEYMMCASTTQVNMVAATISVSDTDQIFITFNRLPSELNYIRADFPKAKGGLACHPIRALHPGLNVLPTNIGPGTGASFISTLGTLLLNPTTRSNEDYDALAVLSGGPAPIANLSPSNVTEWFGRVGGSVASASLTYNGWAALQVPQVTVMNTTAQEVPALCYDLRYAIAFIPLLFAAMALMVLTALSLFRGTFSPSVSRRVGHAYTGLVPYSSAASSDNLEKGEVLVWEHRPGSRPYLRAVEKGYVITGAPNDTALQYFKEHHGPTRPESPGLGSAAGSSGLRRQRARRFKRARAWLSSGWDWVQDFIDLD